MKFLAGFIIIASFLPLRAAAGALEELLPAAARTAPAPLPEVPLARADGFLQVRQDLPPDSGEAGFDWPDASKDLGGDFFYIGGAPTYLKSSAAQSDTLTDGTGKCALAAHTLYKASEKPGFEGEHMKVALAERLPGCGLVSGYIFLSHVSSSSAGGAWELPNTVRAFLDTLAYAEGTDEQYNFIYSFKTFNSYADHPRKVYCSGGLCSSAAGRYQFLPDTWDGLTPELGLKDFTPPSQDKAAVEIFRRAGAYNLVLKSSKYENFTAALSRLNGVWASLPGSPYGQPTHSTASLWRKYKAFLARY